MESRSHETEKNRTFGFLLRAFRHRNYRLFFGGQGLSLIGTWMQQLAMAWLVYRLTNSALLLGVIGFVGQIPIFVLGSFAGVLADRLNRRKLLIVTQIFSMMQAFLLAFLTLTGKVTPWHLLGLSLLLGLINAFDMPARQSFVTDIVDTKNDLGNAIALNSFMFNGARLIGPFVAGILISAVGEGICFLVNSLSFFAIIIALAFMRIPERSSQAPSVPIFQELKEGYRYTFGFTPIRCIILLLGLISLMGMPYVILMPVFARDILHGGPHTLGFLMGAAGVGSLTGAVYLAFRRSILGLGRLLAVASGAFGIGLVIFSLSRHITASLAAMFMVGLAMIVHMASSNTILQTIVDEDKRGRVMSYYAMAFMGMAPFGSLLGGTLASKIGAPHTLMLCGLACVAGSLVFLAQTPTIRDMVRPIYVRMGIANEPSSDMEL